MRPNVVPRDAADFVRQLNIHGFHRNVERLQRVNIVHTYVVHQHYVHMNDT